MNKFQAFLTIGIIGLLTNCYPRFDWGHHFSFTNNTGEFIDSIDIQVGDSINRIIADCNVQHIDSCSLADNISVPKEGYPHEVRLKLYCGKQQFEIKADSFDCYNCDGSHEYIISMDEATYKFHN